MIRDDGCGEGARLRHRAARARRRRPGRADADARDLDAHDRRAQARDAGVHGAGADPRRSARRACGPVLVGSRRLRAPHGEAPVARERRARGDGVGADGACAARRARGSGRVARRARRCVARAREAAGGAVRVDGGGRCRARGGGPREAAALSSRRPARRPHALLDGEGREVLSAGSWSGRRRKKGERSSLSTICSPSRPRWASIRSRSGRRAARCVRRGARGRPVAPVALGRRRAKRRSSGEAVSPARSRRSARRGCGGGVAISIGIWRCSSFATRRCWCWGWCSCRSRRGGSGRFPAPVGCWPGDSRVRRADVHRGRLGRRERAHGWWRRGEGAAATRSDGGARPRRSRSLGASRRGDWRRPRPAHRGGPWRSRRRRRRRRRRLRARLDGYGGVIARREAGGRGRRSGAEGGAGAASAEPGSPHERGRMGLPSTSRRPAPS